MESEKIEIGAEEELRKMISDGVFQDKIIFAMGNIFNIACLDNVLRENGKSVEAIVDNDPNKTGLHLCNGKEYKIVNPDYFFRSRNENTLLLIYSIRFWCEMKEQMLRRGLKEYVDFYVLESLTRVKKIKYVRKGYSLLQDIRKEYGEDAFLLVFYGPMGDNYLFSLFYKQYLEENNIANCVCLGTPVTEKMSELFGLPNFKLIEREELLALEYLYMFLGSALKGVKILHIWEFAFHFNRNRIRFDRRFNFMDTYRDYVYCLQNNREPIIPVFRTKTEIIVAEFNKLELEKLNTVIISPYAYSIPKHPPQKFWIELTEELKAKGMKVAVNINPRSEENFIPSVRILTFSMEDSVPYLEYAGGFIGMRSGFCDVVASASCKKLVLYPKEDLTKIDYDRHRSDKEFGGLKVMGLTEQVRELEFDAEGSSQYWHDMVKLTVAVWEKS